MNKIFAAEVAEAKYNILILNDLKKGCYMCVYNLMEVVKAFNNNSLHTEIVIKGTCEEPLFRATDIGEILEMGNIRTTIQHFDKSEKVVHTMHTLGGDQQVTFLTEKGLYKVLFKSRKPIAEKFQNWVCEIIKEIRLNGVYDLQKQLEKQKQEMELLEENKNKEIELKIIKEKELEKEKLLLSQYHNIGSIVYIIKVKTNEDGTYIIKLGESRDGITGRYNECKSKHKNILLLNCFQVDKSKNFERFLLCHKDVNQNRVFNLQGHESEKELILIGTTLTYKMLLKIIEDNIDNYKYKINELLLENKLLKEKINSNQIIVQSNSSNEITELKELIHNLSYEIVELKKSNQLILNKLNTQETKVVTGFSQQIPHLGPRLQKINPETLQLVKVYESVTEAMNENKNIKRPSITKAIEENTVYCGFRWLLVERNLNPNIIHSIQPTKQTKIQQLGYIAKLNSNKSLILNVYLDRKTAAKLNGYQSPSALDNPVKNETITNDNYYILYDNCCPELIQEFEGKNGKPILYKNGIGQYDLQKKLVKEFTSKYDCIRELKMSDKTLAKALSTNIPYNNFYYRELGAKFFMNYC
jgi:prophage antirepressor-like protein